MAADSLLVGTLNLLGDAYNAFEFMNDDPAVTEAINRLHDAFDALTFEQFLSGCDGLDIAAATEVLQAHCDGGKSLFSFFDEASLKNDNKLLMPRLNLITFGMRRMTPGDDANETLTWQCLERWKEEMAPLIALPDGPYAQDFHLLVWDCACNVVATLEPDVYSAVCSSSPLNPSNFERLAGSIVDSVLAAAAGRPLLLGLQEFPRGDTSKARAFRAAIDEASLHPLPTHAQAAPLVLPPRPPASNPLPSRDSHAGSSLHPSRGCL